MFLQEFSTILQLLEPTHLTLHQLWISMSSSTKLTHRKEPMVHHNFLSFRHRNVSSSQTESSGPLHVPSASCQVHAVCWVARCQARTRARLLCFHHIRSKTLRKNWRGWKGISKKLKGTISHSNRLRSALQSSPSKWLSVTLNTLHHWSERPRQFVNQRSQTEERASREIGATACATSMRAQQNT